MEACLKLISVTQPRFHLVVLRQSLLQLRYKYRLEQRFQWAAFLKDSKDKVKLSDDLLEGNSGGNGEECVLPG